MTVLMVMWILILLSTFSLSYNNEARTELALSGTQVDLVGGRALARSGMRVAEGLAREAVSGEYVALNQGWSSNPVLRRMPIGRGYFSVGWRSQDSVSYGLVDEARWIPASLLTREVVARLPEVGPEFSVAAAVNEGAEMRSGVEPLVSVATLDPETRKTLAPWITEYPTGGVNINTTSPMVLEALGIPARAVERLLARRNGPDGVPGTPDDHPFSNIISPEGGWARLGLTIDESSLISALAGKGVLKTESLVFRAQSRGWVEGRSRFCEIEQVFRVAPEGIETLHWIESWKN